MTLQPPVRRIEALRAAILSWRAQGLSIGLVPTMGALHDGHLALVDRAKARTDRVIVTIFVNPIQFGPGEDFERYPRDEVADLALLAGRGCDLVFAPPAVEIFPDGPASLRTSVSVRQLTDTLCGPHRPGHFTGVATIVMKLLMLTLPDVAVFGEKDYQQLQVIRTMVRDLSVPVVVDAVPTLREHDGLAMSSRNAYLSPQMRALAPRLHQVLQTATARLASSDPPAAVLAAATTALRDLGFEVDYLSLVDADSLATLERLDRPGRLAAAVRLGVTRLIDNVAVTMPGSLS